MFTFVIDVNLPVINWVTFFTILCIGDDYSLFLYVIVPAIVKSRQSK